MNISPIRAEGGLSDVKFLIKDIGKKIKNNDFLLASERINSFFKINNFKDDLFCHIEYPYVDAHYRDSFYFYHSSKIHHIEKDCIRISFFDRPFNLDDPFSDFINNGTKFLGILVIRPTRNNQFGRMILSPDAFNLNSIEIICRKYFFTVRGIKLSVNAFPNSGQDQELHSCSETSLLSVLNYFSKYDNFKDKNPSNIYSVIDSLRYEKIDPGKGMKQNEISFVLKEFGFGVRSYSRLENNVADFIKAFNDYIESGLPVIAILSQADKRLEQEGVNRFEKINTTKNSIAHSLICIGYSNSQDDNFREKASQKSFDEFTGTCIIDYTLFLKSNRKYVFIDDNYAPYRVEDFYDPLKTFRENDNKKEIGNEKHFFISGFVVPLTNRVRMDSYRVRRIFKEKIVKDKDLFFTKSIMNYGFYPLVSRFLITTSNAFKNFYCSNPKIKLDLKLILDSLHLPRFIWIVEIINVNKPIDNQVVGLLILDPNTPTFPDTILFQYFNGTCQVNTESSNGYNEEKLVSIKSLPRYTQNLNLFKYG